MMIIRVIGCAYTAFASWLSIKKPLNQKNEGLMMRLFIKIIIFIAATVAVFSVAIHIPDYVYWAVFAYGSILCILANKPKIKSNSGLNMTYEIPEMQFSDFAREVTNWGDSRKIYTESTWQKQLEKYGAERAELLYAETDKDRMDAYGDQLVCLMHCRNMYTGAIDHSLPIKPLSGIEQLLSARNFDMAIKWVLSEAREAGYSPEKCMHLAWEGENKDGIKYRVGLMVKKIFTKWDDLTHDQRIEVAKSGQLMPRWVDKERCKSFCSDYDWFEITAAEESVFNS